MVLADRGVASHQGACRRDHDGARGRAGHHRALAGQSQARHRQAAAELSHDMSQQRCAIEGRIFDRAGLPRDGHRGMAWLAMVPVTGDYRRDAENFSRQWRIGAELLAMPAGKARALRGASGGRRARSWQRDRAAREKFLRAHVETIYRRLTGDLAKFVRVEHLVRDAAAVVPGLVPDDRAACARERLAAARQGRRRNRSGTVSLACSGASPRPACICATPCCCRGRKRTSTAGASPKRASSRSTARRWNGAARRRSSPCAIRAFSMPRTRPRSTASKSRSMSPRSIAQTDIAVLRGDVVEHPKYRGRRLFSAGINLTHLYHGKISYVWYIKRDMGLVNKLFRGVARPDAEPRRSRRRHHREAVDRRRSTALPSAAAASFCSRSIMCWRRATPI